MCSTCWVLFNAFTFHNTAIFLLHIFKGLLCKETQCIMQKINTSDQNGIPDRHVCDFLTLVLVLEWQMSSQAAGKWQTIHLCDHTLALKVLCMMWKIVMLSFILVLMSCSSFEETSLLNWSGYPYHLSNSGRLFLPCHFWRQRQKCVIQVSGQELSVKLLSLFALSCRIKIPPDCTTELNHNAYLFLQSVFDKHDKVSG